MTSADNNSRASLVRGSSLVSFLPAVPHLERDDILDALLYAELTASARFDRQRRWHEWNDTNLRSLVGCGFAMRKTLGHAPVKVSNEKGFRKKTAVLLNTIGVPSLAAVAASALDTMLDSGHARGFFNDWFSFNTGRSDSFQIVPCERMESGEGHIAVCGLQMVTRTRLTPPGLFLPQWPFVYEMTLVLKGASLAYSQQRYAPHRERVREYLMSTSLEAINRIEL